MHRAPRAGSRLPPWARRLRWELSLALALLAFGSVLFILLSLAVHGHVSW